MIIKQISRNDRCRRHGSSVVLATIIDSHNTCDTSMLKTFYLNLIASQLYAQKWL